MRTPLWIPWLALACASPERYQFEEVAMGTKFRVVLYAQGAEAARGAADAAFDRIHELDVALSDYRPDSELSRLSRGSDDLAGREAWVSGDLGAVLTAAAGVSAATDGAFDVTVGPYVRLWRRAARQGRLPTEDRLEEAGAAVGWGLVDVRGGPGGTQVRLGAPNMRLDLGGIAKGYALDEALEVLRERGITMALVDGGGDLVASGPPPGTAGWLVGIDIGQGSEASLLLRDGACATSGAAFRYVEVDGARYSHVIDPRSGVGVEAGQAATVLGPTGMIADAWASALCVLAPTPGLGIVTRQEGLEARVWQKGGGVPCDSEGFLARMMYPNPNEQPRPRP